MEGKNITLRYGFLKNVEGAGAQYTPLIVVSRTRKDSMRINHCST
jgi:hypothetical protein